MKRSIGGAAVLAAVLSLTWGCGSDSGSSSAPSATATVAPKITAPAAQTPADGQLIGGLVATFAATTASVDAPSFTLQYRFQVFNSSGTLVQDSGLVNSPQWTTNAALTPNTRHTWKVRAESQGFAGPWSAEASFVTPDPPPAFPGPIGNWEACGSQRDKNALVVCVWNAVHPVNSVGSFEVVKRVAWLLRGEGAGLLIKNSGENVIIWQGFSFSASRICYPDGHVFKLIADAGPGGANSPGFGDNDFTDPASYLPAINPSKP